MKIDFTDITRCYTDSNENKTALSNVNFNIKSGSFNIITGPSGSGKSTLMNILGLADNNYSGELNYCIDENSYNFNNKTNTEQTVTFRKRNIGYLHQDFGLIDYFNVSDNILLPLLASNKKKLPRDDVMQYAEMVGIQNLLKRYPNTLSGGEKQRVAICRIFVKNPSLILADEPTAKLDRDNAITVISHLRTLNKKMNKTVIIITHDNALIEEGDYIFKLRDGKLENSI